MSATKPGVRLSIRARSRRLLSFLGVIVKGFYVTIPTLFGVKRWRVEYRKTPGCYGRTDWNRSVIEIDPDQSREEMVDTFVHEVSHVVTGLQHDEVIEGVIKKLAAAVTATLLNANLIATDED